jgi:hypothetical protein
MPIRANNIGPRFSAAANALCIEALISFGLRLVAYHGRPARRIHALFDAVARTAGQREREGQDRYGAHLLISLDQASIQAQPAVEGNIELNIVQPL